MVAIRNNYKKGNTLKNTLKTKKDGGGGCW